MFLHLVSTVVVVEEWLPSSYSISTVLLRPEESQSPSARMVVNGNHDDALVPIMRPQVVSTTTNLIVAKWHELSVGESEQHEFV